MEFMNAFKQSYSARYKGVYMLFKGITRGSLLPYEGLESSYLLRLSSTEVGRMLRRNVEWTCPTIRVLYSVSFYW